MQFILHCVFDDLRVNASHSVDGVSSHNAQVSHVDLLDVTFFDQGHTPKAVKVAGVDLTNTLRRE